MAKQRSKKELIIRKCFRSLVVLTLAFVQSFSAYYVLEGLQSSVNPTVGLISLSLIYGFYCLSSMFLPALVASHFKPHHILAISQLLYMLYTAANFYPTAYTLIPSAVIMGLAAGPLWATARVYVGDLARIHAKAAGKEESLMTGYYFGVFYMYQASQVFGNLLMWFINSMTGHYNDETQVQQQNTTTTTITPTVISNITTTTHTPLHVEECGLFYTKMQSPPTSSADEKSTGKINYLVLTIFLTMQACSALMFSCLLTDISSLKSDEKGDDENGNNIKFSTESSKMVASNDEKSYDDQSTDPNANNQKLCRDSEANYDSVSSASYDGGEYTTDAVGSSKRRSGRYEVMVLVNAMFKLLRCDKTAVLMLLLTFHSGFLHCTVVGDFTRSWISCSKGISFVPSLLAVYGSVSTAASLLNGPLLRVVKVTTLIYFAIFIEMILWISLFWWKPAPTDSILVYILFCAGFGVSNGLIRSLLAHIYAVLYPNCLPAGMALLGSGEAISSSILFGLGDWTPPLVKVVLSMVFGLVGGVTYRKAWRLVKSEKRYWKNPHPSN